MDKAGISATLRSYVMYLSDVIVMGALLTPPLILLNKPTRRSIILPIQSRSCGSLTDNGSFYSRKDNFLTWKTALSHRPFVSVTFTTWLSVSEVYHSTV
ncbi:hypothetical protein J6590_061572 [Homalodisca vitripennis]|nr:hypothetical protein J6590_061572 [Homalodisca vitripennis]